MVDNCWSPKCLYDCRYDTSPFLQFHFPAGIRCISKLEVKGTNLKVYVRDKRNIKLHVYNIGVLFSYPSYYLYHSVSIIVAQINFLNSF